MSNFVAFTALLLIVAGGSSGCSTHSRWAMSDEEYAAKYDKPYEPGEIKQMARKVKQASDARFVSGRSGFFVTGAGSGSPTAAAAEIGGEKYLTSYVSAKASLQGLLAEGAEVVTAGVNLGVRLQSPTRFAPFVGVGTYIGGGEREECGCFNNIDDDDDGFIDEPGEIRTVGSAAFAIYPEIGAHYWLTPDIRLTGSGSYYITNEGRDFDFWLAGFTIAFFSPEDKFKPADEK